MPSFPDLPTELTTDILAAAIPQHPNPGDILAVNSCFNDIGRFIIYTSLRFKSETQLIRFALKRRSRPHQNHGHHAYHTHHHHHHHRYGVHESKSDLAIVVNASFSAGADVLCDVGTSDVAAQKLLPYPPRSICVQIPGGQGSGVIFEGIKYVFEFCAEAAGTGVLTLDNLEFCMNSHTRDPAPWKIGEALSLVNPRKFMWTGPDPPHHFSTAIVPYATYHLFRSMKSWSNLQYLSLTNISFPSRSAFVPVGSSEAHMVFCALTNADDAFLPLETLGNLRSVHIGQATLVPVRGIVKLILARQKTKLSIYGRGKRDSFSHERGVEGGYGGLKEIKLVDAYKESIWQERIRRKDLETVAMEVASSDTPLDSCYHTPTGGTDSEAVLSRIREIVSCEALTERIMGGDRAEGMTTLI